jgi:hypothetical protein
LSTAEVGRVIGLTAEQYAALENNGAFSRRQSWLLAHFFYLKKVGSLTALWAVFKLPNRIAALREIGTIPDLSTRLEGLQNLLETDVAELLRTLRVDAPAYTRMLEGIEPMPMWVRRRIADYYEKRYGVSRAFIERLVGYSKTTVALTNLETTLRSGQLTLSDLMNAFEDYTGVSRSTMEREAGAWPWSLEGISHLSRFLARALRSKRGIDARFAKLLSRTVQMETDASLHVEQIDGVNAPAASTQATGSIEPPRISASINHSFGAFQLSRSNS